MDRLTHLQKMQDRHGDVFTVRPLRGTPSVVVSDPELIKQIFTAPPGVLDAGACNHQRLGWLLGERSLLLLDGQQHIDHRRLLLPSLHGDRLESYAAAMRPLADSHLEDWPTGEQLESLPRLRALALDVALEAVFGSCGDGAGGELRDLLPAPLLVATTGDGDVPASVTAIARAKDLIGEEVTRRRAEAQREARGDILGDLLAARYQNGSALADSDVRDELLGLIVGATGTTANTLAWALGCLARAPEALERATAEAAEGGEGEYVAAVVQETLRMRPAVPIFARLVREPFELGDRSIAPGTVLAPCPLLVHHRPDVYPDPMSFRPERFLATPPGTYTWIPFGGGVRRCIGSNFALLEMRIFLASMLARMTPRAIDEEPEAMPRHGNAMVPSRGGTLVFDPIGSR